MKETNFLAVLTTQSQGIYLYYIASYRHWQLVNSEIPTLPYLNERIYGIERKMVQIYLVYTIW